MFNIRNRKGIKKLVVGMLSAAMLLGTLTGCGEKKVEQKYSKEESASTKVMNIGEYEIFLDEMLVYVVQSVYIGGVTSKTAGAQNNTIKDEVLSNIRETKILYDVAINNNVELSEDDIAYTDSIIKNFKASFSQEFFDAYGISDEVIKKVFIERTYVEKFQNDIKNEMGKTINDDVDKGYVDYEFDQLYYMIFPTVAVDETTGNPATDSDGNYIPLSDDKKAEAKANAEVAVAEIRGGADAKSVAEKYQISEYCTEQIGYQDAYSDELKPVMEPMKDGDCTDVDETQVGYRIIVMLKENDEELKANYTYSIASDILENQFESLKKSWLASIEVDPEKDMVGDVWEKYSIQDMVDDMTALGIISE